MTDLIERPILITGCARSGTSLTAGIIHCCGAWGGDMLSRIDGDKWVPNRNAMFENNEIRQQLVKPYLRSINADPMGQNPLPDLDNEKLFSEMEMLGKKWWKLKVLTTIKRQGYKEGHWFYKGAKMCLFWPLWNSAFPNARWLIVKRKKEDIINSCMKTGFMRKHKTAEGWSGWVDTHEKRFKEMHDAGLDIKEVWAPNVFNNDLDEIVSVIEYLGLEWRDEQLIKFVNPALWRGGKRDGKSN